jgi:protease I
LERVGRFAFKETNMPGKTKAKRIAILIEKQYQDMEVWYPYLRLQEAGHEVQAIGVNETSYVGKYGYPIKCQTTIDKVKSKNFDGVIVPGGWAPDFLRLSPKVLSFVADLDKKGKMVAAICHAGWVIASAKIVSGRKLTSYVAIRDDLVHAGAKWVDKEVVVDGNLITSRTPNDLPAFLKEILKFLEK